MISILMPIYNGIEFIDESVMSIINQTYIHWELIIAINGHPPNSDVYIKAKEYEMKSDKIKVLDLHELSSKATTLNAIVPYCSFDYIAILDVDDIWSARKLEVQENYLQHNYDVVGSRCIYFGERNGIVPTIPIGDIQSFDFKSYNPIINSSCIVRKELCHWDVHWNKYGIEDYALWLHLKKQGKRFFNCNEILVKHRIHNTSAYNSKGSSKEHSDKLAELLATS
jgi:glycosyltransferase involved in cell wall biosynthesis